MSVESSVVSRVQTWQYLEKKPGGGGETYGDVQGERGRFTTAAYFKVHAKTLQHQDCNNMPVNIKLHTIL